MRLPRLLSHIVDSESKSVTFGWTLKITATALYLFVPSFGADRWERMVIIAALLVGGKLVKETILDGVSAKGGIVGAPAK